MAEDGCVETCMHAKPDSPCKCHCGGRNHAQSTKENMGPYDRTVNESLGGEIAEFIKSVKGQRFVCRDSSIKGHSFILSHFIAYPHDGGLADSKGEKWWVYAVCPYCNYQWSFAKIKPHLERQKIFEEQDATELAEKKAAQGVA